MSTDKHEIIFAIILFFTVVFLSLILDLCDVTITAPFLRLKKTDVDNPEVEQCQTNFNITAIGFAEFKEIKEKGTLHGLPVTKYRRTYSSACSILMPPKEITQKAKVLIYNPLEHDDIMTNLTKELSVRNHFSWEENLDEDKQCYDITKNCTSFNTRINKRFAIKVTSGSIPRYVQTTKEFVNLIQYVSTTRDDSLPVYINVLSHPVELFIERYKRTLSRGNKEMPLEDCIELLNGTGCISDQDTVLSVTHFCGEVENCRMLRAYQEGLLEDFRKSCFHSRSLKTSIVYLAKGYIIVGTRDNMEQFVPVLEKLLPQFFSGINHVYSAYLQDHPPHEFSDLSREARNKLEDILSHEMTLYYFVDQRFRRLFQCMK